MTEHFLHPSGPLRKDFEAYANGGEMSEALSAELRAYEWIKFDETAIEGEHALMPSERAHSKRAEFPYMAATLRLRQHIPMIEAARQSPTTSRAFESCWRAWKLVAAPHAFQPSRGRVPKHIRALGTDAVCRRAWRLDASAHFDATALHALFAQRGATRLALTDAASVRHDYVDRAVQTGGIYSFPSEDRDVVESALAVVADGCDAFAEGVMAPAELALRYPRRIVLQLLLKNPDRLKSLQGDESIATRNMWQVQVWEEWAPASTASSLEVFPGEVRLMCVAEEIPWACIRGGLRSWSIGGPSDIGGCTRLSGGGLVDPSELCAVMDSEAPLALRLERLMLTWDAGRGCEEPHIDPSDRRLALWAGFARAPSYLACCLCIDDVLGRGIGRLCIGQHESYYRAALALRDNSMVAPNLLVRDYVAMLEDGASRPLTAIEDAHPPPAKRIRAIDDGFEPQGDVAMPSAIPAPLPPLEDAAPASGDGFEEPGLVAAPVGVSSRWRQRTLAEMEAQCDALQDAWLASSPPSHVCGVPIYLERHHGTDARRDAPYVRCRMTCPSPTHVGCTKSRTLTFSTVFGMREVWGFLGAWAAEAHAQPQCDHGEYKPELHKVMAFLASPQ